MFKKFLDGLAFGSGFAISFIALWYVAAYLITPIFIESQVDYVNIQPSSSNENEYASILNRPESAGKSGLPFHEQALDDQIKNANVIALTKYEEAPDGKMKAIIKEFLKKESGVTLYYDVGDEFESSSYYPKDDTSFGDGEVIFFTGSPATMRIAMTYKGERLYGSGGMPIELLKKKASVASKERL